MERITFLQDRMPLLPGSTLASNRHDNPSSSLRDSLRYLQIKTSLDLQSIGNPFQYSLPGNIFDFDLYLRHIQNPKGNQLEHESPKLELSSEKFCPSDSQTDCMEGQCLTGYSKKINRRSKSPERKSRITGEGLSLLVSCFA
jgi:hypothetical protein